MKKVIRQTIWGVAGAFSRGIMVILVVLGLAPATQASTPKHLTVNDRIARIREAVRGGTSEVFRMEQMESNEDIRLAQWGNWGNWGNWPNWNNWGNWANWNNWGNWGNWPNWLNR